MVKDSKSFGVWHMVLVARVLIRRVSTIQGLD